MKCAGFSMKNYKMTTGLLIFLLIILFAAYFRLAAIDLAEFNSDEARDAFIEKDFIQTGKIPLLGTPTTAGITNAGPIYYLLLAFPFLISLNPVYASAFIAILNIVGIILTYKLAKEFFSERVALISTALVAFSPFAIIFSRKIWNPDMLFPFLVILFYSLYSFCIKRKPKYIIPLFVSFAVLFQIYAATLFLAPIILLFLAKFRRAINLKYFLIGLLAVFIIFSPSIYSEYANNFKNSQNLIQSSLFQFSKINKISIQHTASLTSGTDFGYLLGDSSNSFYSSVHNVDQLFIVENLLLLFGVALISRLAFQKTFSENAKYTILVLWFVLPIIFFLFYTGLEYPHNLLIHYPVQFLILAIFFDFLLTQTKGTKYYELAKFSTFVLLLFVLFSQLAFDQGFLEFLEKNGGTAGFYDIGLKYKLESAKYVAENSPANFSISNTLQPNEIGIEYKYLVSIFGKTPSDLATTKYVLANNLLHKLNTTELQLLSKYQNVNFGPLTVYVVR